MKKTIVAVIIPARYASSRMPGKPLARIAGKTMIQRVYNQTRLATGLDGVYVATDDQRIVEAVQSFGGDAILTSKDHSTGTDRLAEAAETLEVDIVINVQGDQPFIDPRMIEEVAAPLVADETLEMTTLMHPISLPEELEDPGVVKTVVDRNGFALYFSRSVIPFPRGENAHGYFEHIGLYAYRKEFLTKIADLPPTPLEAAEGLEQLRVLEHGYAIRVAVTECEDHEFSGFSVDTPEDLAKAERLLSERDLD